MQVRHARRLPARVSKHGAATDLGLSEIGKRLRKSAEADLRCFETHRVLRCDAPQHEAGQQR